jgi:hypothetical protein
MEYTNLLTDHQYGLMVFCAPGHSHDRSPQLRVTYAKGNLFLENRTLQFQGYNKMIWVNDRVRNP